MKKMRTLAYLIIICLLAAAMVPQATIAAESASFETIDSFFEITGNEIDGYSFSTGLDNKAITTVNTYDVSKTVLQWGNIRFVNNDPNRLLYFDVIVSKEGAKGVEWATPDGNLISVIIRIDSATGNTQFNLSEKIDNLGEHNLLDLTSEEFDRSETHYMGYIKGEDGHWYLKVDDYISTFVSETVDAFLNKNYENLYYHIGGGWNGGFAGDNVKVLDAENGVPSPSWEKSHDSLVLTGNEKDGYSFETSEDDNNITTAKAYDISETALQWGNIRFVNDGDVSRLLFFDVIVSKDGQKGTTWVTAEGNVLSMMIRINPENNNTEFKQAELKDGLGEQMVLDLSPQEFDRSATHTMGYIKGEDGHWYFRVDDHISTYYSETVDAFLNKNYQNLHYHIGGGWSGGFAGDNVKVLAAENSIPTSWEKSHDSLVLTGNEEDGYSFETSEDDSNITTAKAYDISETALQWGNIRFVNDGDVSRLLYFDVIVSKEGQKGVTWVTADGNVLSMIIRITDNNHIEFKQAEHRDNLGEQMVLDLGPEEFDRSATHTMGYIKGEDGHWYFRVDDHISTYVSETVDAFLNKNYQNLYYHIGGGWSGGFAGDNVKVVDQSAFEAPNTDNSGEINGWYVSDKDTVNVTGSAGAGFNVSIDEKAVFAQYPIEGIKDRKIIVSFEEGHDDRTAAIAIAKNADTPGFPTESGDVLMLNLVPIGNLTHILMYYPEGLLQGEKVVEWPTIAAIPTEAGENYEISIVQRDGKHYLKINGEVLTQDEDAEFGKHVLDQFAQMDDYISQDKVYFRIVSGTAFEEEERSGELRATVKFPAGPIGEVVNGWRVTNKETVSVSEIDEDGYYSIAIPEKNNFAQYDIPIEDLTDFAVIINANGSERWAPGFSLVKDQNADLKAAVSGEQIFFTLVHPDGDNQTHILFNYPEKVMQGTLLTDAPTIAAMPATYDYTISTVKHTDNHYYFQINGTLLRMADDHEWAPVLNKYLQLDSYIENETGSYFRIQNTGGSNPLVGLQAEIKMPQTKEPEVPADTKVSDFLLLLEENLDAIIAEDQNALETVSAAWKALNMTEQLDVEAALLSDTLGTSALEAVKLYAEGGNTSSPDSDTDTDTDESPSTGDAVPLAVIAVLCASAMAIVIARKKHFNR